MDGCTACSSTAAEWQLEWTASTKGEWTRRLIPELAPWLTRTHGEANNHLTQVMSGHVNLGAYLEERFRIRDTNAYLRCGSAGDTAEHDLFECSGQWHEGGPRRVREDCWTVKPGNTVGHYAGLTREVGFNLHIGKKSYQVGN